MTKQDKIRDQITVLGWQFSEGDRIAVYGALFHGGGLLSTHTTLAGAARAIVEYHCGSDCMCGGAVAKPAADTLKG